MLPAPPPRQPLQKRPAVQGDMGVLPRHGACAHESMSPQAGIRTLSLDYLTRAVSPMAKRSSSDDGLEERDS
jgi:hypothetical protein